MADKPEKAIRIVLADASRLTTLGITQVLEKEADMEILASVTDGEDAVAKTIELEPDVLIIEADLPGLSGIKATAPTVAMSRAATARTQRDFFIVSPIVLPR